MKNIFIYSETCRRRLLDAKKICTYFTKNNYRIVKNPEKADIIFILTCGFIDNATKNSLNKIKEFQNYNAELIVAGCVPEIDKEELAEIFDGRTISTKNIDHIDDLFPENKIKYKDIDDENTLFKNLDERTLEFLFKKIITNFFLTRYIYKKLSERIVNSSFGRHPWVFLSLIAESLYNIQISRGCNRNCSYCAIRKGIGPLKSKPVERCLEELKQGLDKNYKNFVITADSVGAYGLDIDTNFIELLDKLTSVKGDYKLIIRHLSPIWIIKYIDRLKEIIKRGKIDIICVPYQSGNNRILKLMNRYSDVDKIKNSLIQLKNVYPKLTYFCVSLIGFPTETEEEFKETLDFIKEANIDAGSVFRFSCKKGTEAETIEPKTPESEINNRFIYTKKYLEKLGYVVVYLPKLKIYLYSKNKSNAKMGNLVTLLTKIDLLSSKKVMKK